MLPGTAKSMVCDEQFGVAQRGFTREAQRPGDPILLAQADGEPRGEIADVVVGSGSGTTHTVEEVRVETAVVGTRTKASPAQQTALETAIDAVKRGEFASASYSLVALLRDDPLSEIADEGWFWLGEARYRDRAFQESLSTFKTLLEYFPSSSRVSMARLRIGMNHYELKDFVEARSALSSLFQETDEEEIKIRAEALIKKMDDAGV
jgi:TolA-binding protein